MPHEPGEAEFKTEQVVFPCLQGEHSIGLEILSLQEPTMMFGSVTARTMKTMWVMFKNTTHGLERWLTAAYNSCSRAFSLVSATPELVGEQTHTAPYNVHIDNNLKSTDELTRK